MNFFIKPKTPLLSICVSAFMIVISYLLFTSKYFDYLAISVGSFSFLIAVFMLLATDHSYMGLENINSSINIKGYLGVRKLKLQMKDIKGYEIHEKLDQVRGVQNLWVLVTQDGKKILFTSAVYNNYDELINWIETNFEFLGHKKMKYSEFIGKSYVYITIVSGIIYFLLAMIKLMKVIG